MLSATSWADSSGRLISSTLIAASFPVSCASSSRSLSTSAPRFPITTPGRPVWTVMVTLPGRRSMCTSEMAACPSRVLRYFRISSSSLSSAGISLVANHREDDCRTMPSRSPTGWVFCPMLLALLGVHVDLHVTRALFDRRGPPLRRGGESLQRLTAVHNGLLDEQGIGIEALVLLEGLLLCVGDRRLERLGNLLGRELLVELQN